MQAFRAFVEQAGDAGTIAAGPAPRGVAVFAGDLTIRSLLDPTGLAAHWSEFDRGGHFPGLEVPDLLAGDLRTFFADTAEPGDDHDGVGPARPEPRHPRPAVAARRSDLSTMDAVDRLVGLQAQDANAPYLGLWTRLADSVSTTWPTGDDRPSWRSTLRGTQHLVRADDYPWLRAVRRRLWRGDGRRRGAADGGPGLAELTYVGRDLLADGPITRPAVCDRSRNGGRTSMPTPSRGRRRRSCRCCIRHPRPVAAGWGDAVHAGVDWLGEPVAAEPVPEKLVRRYLAAYGPATVADLQPWSGVTGLAEVVPTLDLSVVSDGRSECTTCRT